MHTHTHSPNQPSKTRISVELVPRNETSLLEELKLIRDQFPSVTAINIPDLLRFEIRSWVGCVTARPFFSHTIPHIRAMDIPPDQPLSMAQTLLDNGIDEVLVVTGDLHPDHPNYDHNALQVIKKFKKEMPGVRVYAAIDQYRQEIQKEYDYIQQKLDAGADGFFTQPFFEIPFMEAYAKRLEHTEVFWGVSPVTAEGSRKYWEKNNKVIFPTDFSITLEWNQSFAKKALSFCKDRNTHIYFMPIRTDLGQYLRGVL